MNQNFNSKELTYLLRGGDLLKCNKSQEEIVEEIARNEKEIIEQSFEFDLKVHGEHFMVNRLSHNLILRKLNDNIRRIYKREQADRNVIIQQVITLLNEGSEFWIIKADIKSFYECIDRERIVKKLSDDALLSYYSIFVLNKVFSHPLIVDTEGLPRGLNISASLSEIYLKKFDEWMIRNPNVYYFARFVDDMLIFISQKDGAELVFRKLKEYLRDEFNLDLNEKKTELRAGRTLELISPCVGGKPTQNQIEYLGYKFTVELSGRKTRVLKIGLADKKINKIKTRIVRSYLEYFKTLDFKLLRRRIEFLTCNYAIQKERSSSPIKVGIFYNYPNLKDFDCLKDLNRFHRKILFANSGRGNFGMDALIWITDRDRAILKKYCFCAGFQKRIIKKFSYSEISVIKKCWR